MIVYGICIFCAKKGVAAPVNLNFLSIGTGALLGLVRQLSDRVCIEHELSVIQNPKQHSKGRFLHYGQWIGEKPPSAQQRVRLGIVAALEQKPADFPAFLRLMEESGFQVKHGRGGAISFLAPGQDKYTRLRASTLGPGFDPDDIRAAIAGERPIPELPQDSPAPARCVNLIIDIQERMAQGKGPAYERWAKVYNIKQMAAALLYLREHDLMDYAALASSTEAAVDRAHKLAVELRDTEAALAKTSELMGAVVQYAKTRPVFDGYKAARYSRKYLAQHEAELADYRAAKAAMRQSVCRQSALKLSLLSYPLSFRFMVRAVRTPPQCSKFCFLGYGCAFFQPLFQTFHAILARDDCRMAVNGSETAAFIAVYPPL